MYISPMIRSSRTADYRRMESPNTVPLTVLRPTARFIGKLPAATVIAVFVVVLAACSGTSEVAYKEQPVEQIYNDGMDAMETGRLVTATRLFDEVERQHPYSAWATKAQLISAYASYQRDAYDEAIIALDRFIELHPGNRDIAYAYYLKALSYYEQISDVGRDQKMTELALRSLQNVVRRFPESTYARDARLKVDLTRDHLAGKGMEIGRYYLRQGHHLAAINRFQSVIEKYQTTTHVPEALHRLTEAYLALGVIGEAQTATAVLGHNYPGSDWYKDSYALLRGRDLQPEVKSGSWLSRAWNWVF
jgi:outer membrane protein assembly factor BamD